MEEVSRRPDILTIYFDTDDSTPFKIDTVVDTLNAMRELYGCFSLLCYGKEPDKRQSTVCFKTGSLIMGIACGAIVAGVLVPFLKPTFTELGNRLRDKLFGKNQKPQENNADISKIIQNGSKIRANGTLNC